jgi:hypothetical protein
MIRIIHSPDWNRSLHRSVRLAAALALAVACGCWQIAAAQTKAATSTTLTVSSGTTSNPATTSGTVFTLTATVTAGSTPLTVGQVSFCVATAKACTDIHRVGLAQLTSAGTAVLKFRPGPGVDQYKAVFEGTTKYAGSASTVASFVVNGPIPSTTLLSAGGTADSYSLTAAVYGNGGTAPTGDVSFLNTSNANAVLGSATLGNAAAGFNLLEPFSYSSLGGISAIAEGDFNSDGIPDIAVVAYVWSPFDSAPSWSVFIQSGLGDGSFSSPVAGASLPGPGAVAVGDFNGDGKLDLAVANQTTNMVMILLGNGDGTFSTSASSPATGIDPLSIAVADFNGDGISDLALANQQGNDITVLLGKGDGTFTPAGANQQTGAAPYFIATADFNGDGITDLTVLNTVLDNNNNLVNTLSVYLGKGDGTFTLVTKGPGTGTPADAVAVGDFNADGIEDLAIAVQQDSSHNTVTVLTGNGDGTFKVDSQTSIPMENVEAYSLLKTGDFNGDSKIDLALRSVSFPPLTYALTMLLGDGAGGFSPQVPSTLGTEDYDIPTDSWVIGDWNGDGVDDIVAPLREYHGPDSLNVFLVENQSATATVNGIHLPLATNAPVVASYPGDKNNQPSTSGVVTLAGALGTAVATIMVTPSAQTITDQQNISLKITVSGSQGMATPTGSVELLAKIYNPRMALSSGAATLTVPAEDLLAGENDLTVFYSGDAVYAGGGTGATTVTVVPVVVTATPPSSIAPGATATSTVTLTVGSTYSGTMNLTCTLSSSPANAQSLPTCALNPPTTTIAAKGNATTTVTFTTTAGTTAMATPLQKRMGWPGEEGLAVAAVLIIGIGSRRRRWVWIAAFLAIVVSGAAIGCGGGGGSKSTSPATAPTTAGSYLFKVTATDSKNTTIATSADVNLTVQ